jgi:hypothetical protein
METDGRIHPRGRRADCDPYCYPLPDPHGIADIDSQQDCHIDAYSYANEDAHPDHDSVCFRYALVRIRFSKTLIMFHQSEPPKVKRITLDG